MRPQEGDTMSQLHLFDTRGLTDPINLHDYDWVVISSSGGKDSQVMIDQIWHLAIEQGYPTSKIVVVHADLGRAEWAGTKALAQKQADAYGLRFEVVARPQGDLLDRIRQRGMWPSSTERYCTAELKRNQIQKVVRRLGKETLEAGNEHVRILNCMGLRAQESPARAKKMAFQCNTLLCTKKRTVDDWLPILDWTEDEVWRTIKTSGVPYHRAYDLGMPRLSCVFCIFAPRRVLILAGHHNRELLDEYVQMEVGMKHTFRQTLSIAEVKEAVAAGETTAIEDGNWNM